MDTVCKFTQNVIHYTSVIIFFNKLFTKSYVHDRTVLTLPQADRTHISPYSC